MPANLKFLKTLRIAVNKPVTISRIREEILILMLALPPVFNSLALVRAMHEELMTEDQRRAS
jgi:hypothetical protein